jgi:hypothetical protein
VHFISFLLDFTCKISKIENSNEVSEQNNLLDETISMFIMKGKIKNYHYYINCKENINEK